MPQASVVTSSTAASRIAAPTSFDCTWKAGSGATWVHMVGELDAAASRKLSQALLEVVIQAHLVVLDMRELTFMDCFGLQVILDAVRDARREGRRMIVVRGPVPVDRVFTLTGASDQVLIIDVDPTEPDRELLHLAPTGAGA